MTKRLHCSKDGGSILPSSPPSFEQAIELNTRKAIRRREKLRHDRRIGTLQAAGAILLLIVGILIAISPNISQWQVNRKLEQQARAADTTVQSWPSGKIGDQVKAAKAYNKRISDTGIVINSDPFNEDGTLTDSEYASLLNTDGNGLMGEILIPGIGVDLPIRHGTSGKILDENAGHLYGTSLPVGGEGTHTVIAAHSYYDESNGMFTRLDEMKKGDAFYLKILGRTLAYKVTSITIVNPDQSDAITLDQDKDQATLLTCIDNGNKRLLVTGERNHMPDQVPYPEDAPKDQRSAIQQVGLAGGAVMVVGVPIIWSTQRTMVCRHQAMNRSRKGRKGRHSA